MKIAFHGGNAANFRAGFAEMLDGGHEIVDLRDALDHPGEREHFASAEVIIGIRLGAAEPHPAKLRLYHAPAAGVDAIDVSRLPKGAQLCNCFGHEHAIAEYVFAALLQRHVPVSDADALEFRSPLGRRAGLRTMWAEYERRPNGATRRIAGPSPARTLKWCDCAFADPAPAAPVQPPRARARSSIVCGNASKLAITASAPSAPAGRSA